MSDYDNLCPYVIDKERGLVALVLTLEQADVLWQVLGWSASSEERTEPMYAALGGACGEIGPVGTLFPRLMMVKDSTGEEVGTWRLEERK